MRKIEHYSAGHFKPPFIQKTWKRTKLTCNCLIIYENEKVMLVDCGMHPDHLSSRLSAALNKNLMGAQINPSQTMKSHLSSEGVTADQVTDILVTHLHYDHCGGMVDFPRAHIHLHQKEWDWAQQKSESFKKNTQFVATAFEHLKTPVLYNQFPQNWNGFSATSLKNVSPDILMVPLPGHSPGHCGYVIPCGEETIFHVGDAFFVIEDLQIDHNRIVSSEIVQIGIAYDANLRNQTLRKISELDAKKIPGLKIINSHDEKLLDPV